MVFGYRVINHFREKILIKFRNVLKNLKGIIAIRKSHNLVSVFIE